MNDNIWHLRPCIEDALSPIFDLFDERQHCLLGKKPRTSVSELQYDADKLDMALLLLCERMPQYLLKPEDRNQSALSERQVVEPIGGYNFLISVNCYAGYDLVVHTEEKENLLHHKGLKLAAVVAALCNLFYNEFDADPDDTHGILSFKPGMATGT
jgi:hypothetical protein